MAGEEGLGIFIRALHASQEPLLEYFRSLLVPV